MFIYLHRTIPWKNDLSHSLRATLPLPSQQQSQIPWLKPILTNWLNFDLVVPKGSHGETNLWVPLPFNADYQTVKSIQFEGNYNTAYITENNRYGAKTLFANWDENANKRALTIKLVLETQDREPMQQGVLQGYQPPEKIHYSVDVLEYLKPTAHIKTDGIVKTMPIKS